MPVPRWHFLQPFKVHVSKISNMSYNILLIRDFITTFVIGVSHLLGEIFRYKNKFLQEKNFP